MSATPVDWFIEQDARGIVSASSAGSEQLRAGSRSKPIDPRSLYAAVE